MGWYVPVVTFSPRLARPALPAKTCRRQDWPEAQAPGRPDQTYLPRERKIAGGARFGPTKGGADVLMA